MKKIVVPVIAVVLASFAGGCGVSKQLHEEKVAALGACEQNLSSTGAERDSLKAELEKVRAELGAMKSEAEKSKTGLYGCEAGLKRTESDLKKALADLQAAEEKLKSGQGTGSQELSLALKGCRDELALAKAEIDKAKKEADAVRQRENELRAKLEKELADKNVEIEKLKGGPGVTVKVLDSILFDQGTAEIKASGLSILDKVAGAVANSKEKIRVEGHTDDMAVGASIKEKWPSNWELSAARAASVVRYFQWGKNIDPARMEAVGRAQYHPAASNDAEPSRAKNRRVVIVLTPGQ